MIDFARIWDEKIAANPAQRHHEAVDCAFWQGQAQTNAQWTRAIPNTLERLSRYLNPSMSLLELGAGTGRFALQLAPYLGCVTALDYSSHMLAALEQKRHALGLHNVTIECANFKTATLQPHDTVLAAWSLYSSEHILQTLERLVAASKQQLMIVDDDASGSPHKQWRRKLWEEPASTPAMPKYLVLTGVLWQLGIRAELQIIPEEAAFQFASLDELLSKFCPHDADTASKEVFLSQLEPYLNQTEQGWHYRYPFEVAFIHWQRQADSLTSKNLNSNNFNSSNLTSNNLTSNSCKSNSFKSDNLTSNSFKSSNLKSNSLNSSNCKSNSFKSDNLTSNSFKSSNLKSNNLNSSNLTSNSFTSNSLNSSNCTSNSLNSSNLKFNDFNSSNLTSNSCKSNNLKSNSCKSSNLKSNNFNSSNLTSNSLKSNNLTSNSLNSSNCTSKNLNSSNLKSNNFNSSNCTSNSFKSSNLKSNNFNSSNFKVSV